MVRRVRTGVVGLGRFGSYHLKHHAMLPGAELVALADIDPRKADLAELHSSAFHTDYRDLIGHVEAVSIAVPTSLHHAVARDFIEAGVHVLVEKPITERADLARDLIHRARTHGVVLQVGHIERFSSTYRALKDAVSRPLLIECQRHSPWAGRSPDADVVLDLMIHDIDLALDLVPAPVERIEATGVAVVGRDLDVANARLSFADGTVAELSASRLAPAAVRSIRVVERDRVATADLIGRTVSLTRAGGAQPMVSTIEVGRGDALGDQIAAFLAAVSDGARQGADGQAGLDALVVAERIGALAQTGSPMVLADAGF